MRTAGLLVCLLATRAFAQPVPDPPPAPAPDPASTSAPTPPATPAPTPAPPPSTTGAPTYYQPQPAAPAAMVQPAPERRSLHDGFTLEVNLGAGKINSSSETNAGASGWGVGGLSLGLGGWLTPRLAITGRLAGVTIPQDMSNYSAIFVGPAAQFWINDHFWAGGGLGLGILYTSYGDGRSASVTGFSLDLRAGYTFNLGSVHTINASLELNPGRYTDQGSTEWLTGVGILVGYQLL